MRLKTKRSGAEFRIRPPSIRARQIMSTLQASVHGLGACDPCRSALGSKGTRKEGARGEQKVQANLLLFFFLENNKESFVKDVGGE